MSSFKVVFLGEGRVGKTSLVLRFVQNQYSDSQTSTIQASFLKKAVVIDDQPVLLTLWDTAGQERFHALGPIYYRDANGAVLVYDITDQESFNKVKKWVRELHDQVGPNISIVICGNKCDLERQRVVDQKAAEEFARSVGARHFSTSAKANRNVADTFLYLAQDMLRRRDGAGRPTGGDEPSSGGLRLRKEPAPAEKPGCC
ncbi:putative Ras-related protein Rab-21 [Paratrimastix pyriformis]|uniref:Ras-related protein Rab-21 n=1 Tax=Paratrimastix pyriformis TaxID=342808 RepID=A0ABQ8UM07_9EUKA|nr:putative Ras-related protein Rab-21 [Paratrimastix pyriformis]